MLLQELKAYINRWFDGKQPWQVSRDTVVSVIGLYLLFRFYQLARRHGVKAAAFRILYTAASRLPGTKQIVAAEKSKLKAQIEKSLIGSINDGEEVYHVLPAKGVPSKVLLTRLQRWRDVEDSKWKKGQVSGGIYHGGEELLQFLATVYGYFALSNPLHPDVFPYIRKMEAELVSISVNLFHGKLDQGACGTTTSGGTESILLACKAYRDRGRDKGIEVPEIIAPLTVHAAFNKAAEYFGFKLIQVPVNPRTFRVDIEAVKQAINGNTVALVGSAPCFGQGVIDSIPELSELALKHDIGLHVDCCLGGFLLPFAEKLGYKLPVFDFRLKGVTSISADTHKYGYAPKGTSVVMYSSEELRHYQYFTNPAWMGGIYASPTMPGSRPGGLVAAAWAALVTMGEEGYLECADKIMKAAKDIAAGVATIPGLHICGDPDLSVVSWAPDEGANINIFKVAAAMSKRGYKLNTLQNPPSMHICCTYLHKDDFPARFVQNLREAVADVQANPKKYEGGDAAMYGAAAAVPDKAVIGDFSKIFIDTLFKV